MSDMIQDVKNKQRKNAFKTAAALVGLVLFFYGVTILKLKTA